MKYFDIRAFLTLIILIVGTFFALTMKEPQTLSLVTSSENFLNFGLEVTKSRVLIALVGLLYFLFKFQIRYLHNIIFLCIGIFSNNYFYSLIFTVITLVAIHDIKGLKDFSAITLNYYILNMFGDSIPLIYQSLILTMFLMYFIFIRKSSFFIIILAFSWPSIFVFDYYFIIPLLSSFFFIKNLFEEISEYNILLIATIAMFIPGSEVMIFLYLILFLILNFEPEFKVYKNYILGFVCVISMYRFEVFFEFCLFLSLILATIFIREISHRRSNAA